MTDPDASCKSDKYQQSDPLLNKMTNPPNPEDGPGPTVRDSIRIARESESSLQSEELESAVPGAPDRTKLAWERLVHDLHTARTGSAPGTPAKIAERLEQWRLAPEHAWDLRMEAERCGLSYSRFRECFREHFGVAPHRFLTKLRMDFAARRLVRTDQPVKQIAADLGYDSLEGFYRAFGKTHGLAPAEFRHRLRF